MHEAQFKSGKNFQLTHVTECCGCIPGAQYTSRPQTLQLFPGSGYSRLAHTSWNEVHPQICGMGRMSWQKALGFMWAVSRLATAIYVAMVTSILYDNSYSLNDPNLKYESYRPYG